MSETPPLITDETPEDLSGIPERFHALAREHGADLVRLVYASGIAQHGLESLVRGSGGHPAVTQHTSTIAQMFNLLAESLMRQGGYGTKEVTACRVALEEKIRTQIVVPKGRIVLDQ